MEPSNHALPKAAVKDFLLSIALILFKIVSIYFIFVSSKHSFCDWERGCQSRKIQFGFSKNGTQTNQRKTNYK